MTERVRSLFRNLLRRRRVERALDDEMQSSLEILIDQKVASGMSSEEARRASLIELGGVEQVQEQVRWSRSGAFVDGLRQDLGYALRRLGREPGFTATAIVILALTTGPVIAITGVANWLFLRPLPGVADADRLIGVNFGAPGARPGSYTVSRVSPGHLTELVALSPSVTGAAGWQPETVVVGRRGATPRETRAEFVSAQYFDVLGVRLSAGRTFRPEEDRAATAPVVAIVGETLARRLFDRRDPIGEVVTVNGSEATIVGVAPEAFGGTNRMQAAEIWVPGAFNRRLIHLPPDQWQHAPDTGPFYMHAMRLAPGATRERAGVELTHAASVLLGQDPAAHKFERVRPLLQDGVASPPPALKTVLGVLFGVGVLLVLLGAANLANLFVFRTIRRTDESAVRRALGASAGRLARLHLAEAMMIAIVGAWLGLAVAHAVKASIGQALFAGRLQPQLPIDWRLAALTLAIGALITVVLGVLPARLAMRVHVAGVLARSGRTSTRRGVKLRAMFSVVQLALSLVLLIGALLFTTTLRNLRAIDLGFEPSNALVLIPGFRPQGYSSARVTGYYRNLLPQVARLPGVSAVAVSDGTPFAGGGVNATVIPVGQGRDQALRTFHAFVTPGYFRALGIDFLSGRPFEESETLADVPEHSVVVSESLAQRLFGQQSAVGRTLLIPVQPAPQEVRIVGVVRDVRFTDLVEAPPDVVYRPKRVADSMNDVLLVRSHDTSPDVTNLVRGTAAAMDPAMPLDVFSMQEAVDAEVGPQRVFAWASGLLSVLGFVLAAIGVYGLASQAAVERTREFGIRLALGAARWQVMRLVASSAIVVTMIGAPLGLLLAALASRVVANQLFGVTATDPGLYALAAITLVAVVLAASAIPAWLGSRVNPVDVMRAE